MRHWIKRLLHCHEWQTVKTKETEYLDTMKRVVASEYTYIQQCHICGKMRKYTFET